ncbi:MAG: flagellar hook capping FlgD N-terminal domain-containing protein [Pseudomonadota bacterium]
MTTSPITASDAASAIVSSQPANSNDANDAAAISSDFETFLQLLTAQLENQDPLKPLESTEFVAQLAQFSAVEQQVRSNDTLDEILSALSGGGASLGEWLGAEVGASAALKFDGAPITLTTTPEATATEATLVVRTADGTPVARIPVEPAATEIVWDGSTAAGGTAPEGFYRFTVERAAEGAPLPDDAPEGFARVVEARIVSGETRLILESGDDVPAAEVVAIRLPPEPVASGEDA